MEYLYHRKPKNMKGTILYPLNYLKISNPEIYEEGVKKYKGREVLLKTEIPPLSCLWNDVIHLTAVHPEQLKKNLALAGVEIPETAWFKIPVNLIQGENSIAFIYRRDQDIKPKFNHYEKFDPNRIEYYRIVPPETIEYYKIKNKEGERPLLFHLVPHILYKGNIDVKNLDVITC